VGPGDAWNALARLVHEHVTRDGAAANALQAALAYPEDHAVVHEQSQAFDRMTAIDPEFAEQVRALWPLAN